LEIYFGAFTLRELIFDEFKSGGLHEKHTVATWKLEHHFLEDRGIQMKPVSRWALAGPSGCIMALAGSPENEKI
jgi:hypothetical protein